MAIERNFDEALVAGLAVAEKQIQQNYRPWIGVHKWFARRPGSLFRGLMAAEWIDRPLAETYFEPQELTGTVLDPFMGGGTTLVEANRLGLSGIGYDVNPMSCWVVERELEGVTGAQVREWTERLIARIETEVGAMYDTECRECGESAPVKYFLWVKQVTCSCGTDHRVWPGSIVARRGRHTHDVLVCDRCGKLSEVESAREHDACLHCAEPLPDPVTKSTACSTCGDRLMDLFGDAPPVHHLFALEYFCRPCKTRKGRRGRFFKAPDAKDRQRVAAADKAAAGLTSDFLPTEAIPAGDETNRLLRWGYASWTDLFNARQLVGLVAIAEAIGETSGAERRVLATIFSDYLRYQNMVCRYDTKALKALDVFSVHGFPIHRVQAECALLGAEGVGSGGLRHIAAKYAKAKDYCERPFEVTRAGTKKVPVPMSPERIESAEPGSEHRAIDLRCASICDDPQPEGTVDAVLTDPPYFSSVQYSELMNFCFVWLRRLVPDCEWMHGPSAHSTLEVTGNVTQGRGLPEFAHRLSEVFCAATLALKTGGPFCFTYHHNKLDAYAPVVMAMLDADLSPASVIACPSEMHGSVHISKTDSSRLDTVFVLRKGVRSPIEGWEVDELVDRHADSLTRAAVPLTRGDLRCIRYGVLALTTVLRLSQHWQADRDTSAKLAEISAALRAADGIAEVSRPLVSA